MKSGSKINEKVNKKKSGSLSGGGTGSRMGTTDGALSSNQSNKVKGFREPLVKVLSADQINQRCTRVEA